MLSPQELRKDDFSRSIRGYSAEEVDEHINYIIEKYAELYQANDELERKLRTALSEIDNFRQDEKAIKIALVNAQKASAAMLSEASTKADSIIEDSKTTCGKILSEFDSRISEKRDELYKMEKLVELFKKTLFEEYHEHIARLEKISLEEGSEFTNFDLPEDYFLRKVKREVEQRASEKVSSGSYEIKLGTDENEVPCDRSDETSPVCEEDDPIFETGVLNVQTPAEKEAETPEFPESTVTDYFVKTEDTATEPAATVVSDEAEVADSDEGADAIEEADAAEKAEEKAEKEDIVFEMKTDGEDFIHFEGENIDRGISEYLPENLKNETLPENEDEDDDIIIATRTPVGSEMTSVKHAIKALNLKLKNEEAVSDKDDPSDKNDKAEQTDENDDFIQLLKKAALNTETKRHSEMDEVYPSGKARKSSDELSITDEFDIVYNKNKK